MRLSDHFSALTELLHQYDHYWRPFPFRETHLPWADQHPALAAQLLALSDDAVQRLATDPMALADFMGAHLPFVPALTQLCALPLWPRHPMPELAPRLRAGIPGRKWQQIEAFAAALPAADLPILEWCGGKSHLGFVLRHCFEQPVTALEWNVDLVAQANRRAQQWQSDLRSYQVDVLTPAVADFFQRDQRIVALHACGDLHLNLLRLSVLHGVQQVQLAPCCYQKIADEHYQPLSQVAQHSPLVLNRLELHLAVTETVTAGAYQQRQRLRLQAMRLGFDCLQRDVRGLNKFLPVPSLSGEWARADFNDFCHHCANLKSVTLPEYVDWNHYEQQGWQRLRVVSAFDLVRFLFRRPLEIWLALDRALFLQEKGYETAVGTFCPRHATPRNILIVAERCKP